MPAVKKPQRNTIVTKKEKLLLEWFRENKIWYDRSKIEVHAFKGDYSGDSLGMIAVCDLDPKLGKECRGEDNDLVGSRSDSSDESGWEDIESNASEDDEMVLCRIPKSAVLSARTTAMASLFDSSRFLRFEDEIPNHSNLSISKLSLPKTGKVVIFDEERKQRLRLALAILFEQEKGKASPWYGYLQSLPSREDCPLFWDIRFIEKRQPSWQSFEILSGSSLALMLEDDKQRLISEYLHCIVPFIEENQIFLGFSKVVSFERFLDVMSLITSRAFHVDDYHGDALVPLADIFNHKSGFENVRIHADQEVCLNCGKAFVIGCDCFYGDDFSDTKSEQDPTSHTEEDEMDNLDGHSQVSDDSVEASDFDDLEQEDYMEMVLVRPCLKGQEVFNTFGNVPNSILLRNYGFAEAGNVHDEVAFHERDIKECVGEEVFEQVTKVWKKWQDEIFNFLDESENEGANDTFSENDSESEGESENNEDIDLSFPNNSSHNDPIQSSDNKPVDIPFVITKNGDLDPLFKAFLYSLHVSARTLHRWLHDYPLFESKIAVFMAKNTENEQINKGWTVRNSKGQVLENCVVEGVDAPLTSKVVKTIRRLVNTRLSLLKCNLQKPSKNRFVTILLQGEQEILNRSLQKLR